MKKYIYFLFILCGLMMTSCGTEDPLDKLCEGATADSYSDTFKLWCPTQNSNFYLHVKYGCAPSGESISPPIRWSGVPKEATHLRLWVEDATCTYMCNSCCQFCHMAFDLPLQELKAGSVIFPQGIEENAAKSKYARKFMLPNTNGKRDYMPFCPPNHQVHAFVIKAIAYHLEKGDVKIDGRSQSHPLLFSTDR